jgi:hypothetical protein
MTSGMNLGERCVHDRQRAAERCRKVGRKPRNTVLRSVRAASSSRRVAVCSATAQDRPSEAIHPVVILFLNPDYRPAIWRCAIWFLAGLADFAFHARFRRVRSPEEEFALVEGRKEAARRQERRLA